jgi:hypothetical protein
VIKKFSLCLLNTNDITFGFFDFTSQSNPLVSCINASNIPTKNFPLPIIGPILLIHLNNRSLSGEKAQLISRGPKLTHPCLNWKILS